MKCAADVDAGQERVDEMRRELVDILGYQGQRRCRRDPSGPDVALMASPAPALAILSHFYFAISPSVQACKNKSHSLFADTCASSTLYEPFLVQSFFGSPVEFLNPGRAKHQFHELLARDETDAPLRFQLRSRSAES